MTSPNLRASDSATTLIQSYYAAFNRDDGEAMLALLAPDVVHDLNEGGRETGVEAFRVFMARMRRCYAEQLSNIRIIASPDGLHAAAEYVVSGKYLNDDVGLPPATGQSYSLSGGAFFDIAEGRITRVSNFYNLNEWIAQVSR